MLVLVTFYVKMITYLVQYIDRIQVAANYYLFFPTAPRKKQEIEKETDDMDKSQIFPFVKWISPSQPLNTSSASLLTSPV